MRVGQNRRRDTAEMPIVKDLRKLGYTVIFISGKGAPDVLVISPQRQHHAGEMKTGRGKLTPAQIASGAGVLWPVWRTTDDVLATFGALR